MLGDTRAPLRPVRALVAATGLPSAVRLSGASFAPVLEDVVVGLSCAVRAHGGLLPGSQPDSVCRRDGRRDACEGELDGVGGQLQVRACGVGTIRHPGAGPPGGGVPDGQVQCSPLLRFAQHHLSRLLVSRGVRLSRADVVAPGQPGRAVSPAVRRVGGRGTRHS